MAFRKPDLKKPSQSAMALAIAAIEGQSNPIDDAELAVVDPASTSLDLPDECIDGRTQSSALRDKLGDFEE